MSRRWTCCMPSSVSRPSRNRGWTWSRRGLAPTSSRRRGCRSGSGRRRRAGCGFGMTGTPTCWMCSRMAARGRTARGCGPQGAGCGWTGRTRTRPPCCSPARVRRGWIAPGCFRCAELDAELTVADAGGALYGGFSGFFGQGRMETLTHVGGRTCGCCRCRARWTIRRRVTGRWRSSGTRPAGCSGFGSAAGWREAWCTSAHDPAPGCAGGGWGGRSRGRARAAGGRWMCCWPWRSTSPAP